MVMFNDCTAGTPTFWLRCEMKGGIAFSGKLKPETMVFTIKKRVFSCKISLAPIQGIFHHGSVLFRNT